MVTQILEVFVIRLGLYFLQSPVSLLDLLAFTGYKYVALNINMVMGVMIGPMAYVFAMIYTGACMAFVMLKSMGAAVPKRRNESPGPRREFMVLGFALLQFLSIWWLGYSRDLKK